MPKTPYNFEVLFGTYSERGFGIYREMPVCEDVFTFYSTCKTSLDSTYFHVSLSFFRFKQDGLDYMLKLYNPGCEKFIEDAWLVSKHWQYCSN